MATSTQVAAYLKSKNAPSQTQLNQKFMTNNPQYGAGQTASGSMGQPAKAPAVNPPTNTLPSDQAKPVPPPQTEGTGTGNTGLVGTGNALANGGSKFSQATTGLLNVGVNNDPQYQKLIEERNAIKANLPVATTNIMNDTTRGIPQTVEQARTGATASQYSDVLSAKEAEISNYLTGRNQQIGALGTVSSQTSPVQVSPGNFYVSPETGKDVSGGNIDPFGGGVRQAGVEAGKDFASGNQAIESARNLGNQFVSQVNANPNFNSSDFNIGNAITQLVSNNFSDPKFPGIQSAFNNVVDQYSSVLGGRDKVIALISAAHPTSMQALLKSLDDQAVAVNNARKNYGGVNTPLNTQINNSPNTPAPTTAPTGSTYNGITLPH